MPANDLRSRAIELYNIGDLQGAKELLGQHLQMHPEDSGAWLYLAYSSSTALEKKMFAQKALEADPSNAPARMLLSGQPDQPAAPAYAQPVQPVAAVLPPADNSASPVPGSNLYPSQVAGPYRAPYAAAPCPAQAPKKSNRKLGFCVGVGIVIVFLCLAVSAVAYGLYKNAPTDIIDRDPAPAPAETLNPVFEAAPTRTSSTKTTPSSSSVSYSAAEKKYMTALYPVISSCSDSMKAVESLSDEASEDKALLSDYAWQDDFFTALDDLEISCSSLDGFAASVPARFQALDENLKSAAFEVGQAAKYMRQGIENQKSATFNTGADHYKSFCQYLVKADAEIDSIKAQ